MQTRYHAYEFDTRDAAQKANYAALRARLTAQGLKCFESHGGRSHYNPALDGRTLELETKHLFENQWNTAPIEGVSDKGLRVFDWAQDAYVGDHIGPPRHLKLGHYLDQTPEMVAIRRDTLKCGYCGAQEPASAGLSFCPHCVDSEYLKVSDLPLTRLRPVCDGYAERPPWTDAELAEVLPRYRDAQAHGATARGRARMAADRKRITEGAAKTIKNAEMEREGLLWLLDHGRPVANVIFYAHRGVFCFGWRTRLEDAVLSDLLDIISEFKFPYEILCADGRTLSGNI